MTGPSGAPVLVTGATGTVGAPLVRELVALGAPVRAAVRGGAQRRDLPAGVEQVPFDLLDATTWPAAYDGVERVFLLRPPQMGRVERDVVPALESARAVGVRHVVLLSVQGAERNPLLPHRRLERWLEGSGLAWTFVRPSYFCQNLSTTHARPIRERGEVVVPAGRGRTSFVDARDVAAVAARTLVEDGHEGRAWVPTGAAALTYDEVAAVLGRVLERPVRYTDPTPWDYARHARDELGLPPGMVALTVLLYTVARLGRAAGVTDDVLRVTGRPPYDLERFVRDHVAAWR